MPTLKPHKGLLKRVKISARGKIIRHKANKGHLMATKSGNRRRRLGKAAVIGNAAFRKIVRRQLALE